MLHIGSLIFLQEIEKLGSSCNDAVNQGTRNYNGPVFLDSTLKSFMAIWFLAHITSAAPRTRARAATDGETFGFPSSGREQGTRCFAFILRLFAQSFGDTVACAGQRAKAKYLGFAGTTAWGNKPGSGSTSLKAQQESIRAFLALLLFSPSLHSSHLAVIRPGTSICLHPRLKIWRVDFNRSLKFLFVVVMIFFLPPFSLLCHRYSPHWNTVYFLTLSPAG